MSATPPPAPGEEPPGGGIRPEGRRRAHSGSGGGPRPGGSDAGRSGPRRGDRSPAPGRERAASKPGGETLKRVLFALPWIAFAIAIVALGGPVFAGAMVAIGGLCMYELFAVTAERGPARLPAYAAMAALVAGAYLWGPPQVLLLFMASIPVLFLLSLEEGGRGRTLTAVSLGLLGVAWIGLPLAHAVLLRELPVHGAALLVNVLVGTFMTDTGAYMTGRMFGHRHPFPRMSPNKTLEGLFGGFLIGVLSVWFAGLYQDWLSGVEALTLGAAVALAAPVGDLFESAIKREIGVKDTGTVFGPHGGLLDRLDAALFAVVVGYYVSLALVY